VAFAHRLSAARSSRFGLQMKKMSRRLPMRDESQSRASRPIGPVSRLPVGAPASTSVPPGTRTRAFSRHEWLPATSMIRSTTRSAPSERARSTLRVLQTAEEWATRMLAEMRPRFPYLAEHAEQHMAAGTRDGRQEFEFGLDLILDGLKKLRRKRSAT